MPEKLTHPIFGLNNVYQVDEIIIHEDFKPLKAQTRCLKIIQNVSFQIWHFPPFYVLSGNTILLQANLAILAFLMNFCQLKMKMLNETFLCDFQTLCQNS